MNKTVLAHVSLLTANLIYAINYTFAKDVMPNYIQPSGFILLRVIGALSLFSFVYFVFVNEKIHKKDVTKFIICGLFGVAINQLLFFEGLNLTTPINAAIIMTCNPILVIIMSFLILKDMMTFKKVLGIVLGILGASSLILNSGSVNLSSDFQIGNLFVFINATSYAIYLVLVKPLMKKYKPITVMFYVFSFGFLFVVPFGASDLSRVKWMEIPTVIYLEIIFVVVCTTFIAYLLNAFALKKLTPSTVSVYIYLQPIFAALFAILLKSDTISNQKIISCAIIFLAVYMVSVSSKTKSNKKLS